MILSIVAIIIFCIFVLGFVLNPRKSRENGIVLLVFGQIYLIITIGLGAAIYHLMKIAVNLLSVSIFVAAVDVILVGRIFVKKRFAKLNWRLSEAIGIVVLIVIVCTIAFIRFGTGLKLTYGDIDAARYFQQAVSVMNNEDVHGEFLSTLIQVIFISVCKPFLPAISYYKGLILSHIYMQVLNTCTFYVLISSVANREKENKWINPVITLLYISGYQMYSFVYGTFIHATDGLLFVIFLVYYTIRLQKATISNLRGIVGLLFGTFGVLICYPFYMVIVVPIFLPEAILWISKNFVKLKSKEKITLVTGIVFVTILGLFFAAQRIDHSAETLFENLRGDGLAYKEPYMDFIFFIPVMIVYVGLMRKTKKEYRTILRMNICAIGFTVAWFGLYMNDYLSSYYYYRMYYVLWLMAWLMVGHTVKILWAEKQKMYVEAYTVLYGLAIITSIFGINEKLWKEKSEMFLVKENNFSLCPLYAFNYQTITGEYKEAISEAEFGLYGYVIDNLGQVEVSMISSFYTTMQSSWYIGITGIDKMNISFQLDSASLMTIFDMLDHYYGTKYILIEKSDGECMKYYDNVFSKLNLETENVAGYVFYKSEGSWTELIHNMPESTTELVELFEYVRTTFHVSSVQLVCEGELAANILQYGAFAGEGALTYAGNISPEDFIPMTYRFNIDEVEYMTVLKDSQMYLQNQEYFDAQEILFENEAGMVITHAGTGWMPSEQE